MTGCPPVFAAGHNLRVSGKSGLLRISSCHFTPPCGHVQSNLHFSFPFSEFQLFLRPLPGAETIVRHSSPQFIPSLGQWLSKAVRATKLRHRCTPPSLPLHSGSQVSSLRGIEWCD